MNRQIRKRSFPHVRPAKIQISLRILAVWSDSSLGGRQGCKVSKCGQRRLRSDCADAQADLSLRWARISEGRYVFSRYGSNMIISHQPVRICFEFISIYKTHWLYLSFIGVISLYKCPINDNGPTGRTV